MAYYDIIWISVGEDIGYHAIPQNWQNSNFSKIIFRNCYWMNQRPKIVQLEICLPLALALGRAVISLL